MTYACLAIHPIVDGEEPDFECTPKSFKEGKALLKNYCLTKTYFLDIQRIYVDCERLSDSQTKKLKGWIETVCENIFKEWKEGIKK